MARKPKIKMTRQEQDELWRGYQLATAFRVGKPIEIDGITFDLSCEVDPKVWRPIAPLGTYSYEGIKYGPRIQFPWTPEAWVERWRSEGEVIDAPIGSMIKVAVVDRAPLRATFQHLDLLENRERILLYIWVFQIGGDLKVAEPPLQLIAETATAVQIELENYSGAHRSLVAKLEQLLECKDLEILMDGPEQDWPVVPEHLSLTYRRALMALHEGVEKMDEHAYVAFGYLMARAEAEQQLLDLALREDQAARDRAKGNRARSEKSRQKTERLRDLAKSLILGNATLSLTACAKGVAAIVSGDETWKMSTDIDWISDQVRELFDRREVGGRLEYRPKAEWVRPT